MGQLHNRENDTFSDSYVAEQCKTNDCDPSHPTAGNTQILSHPRSPLDDITDIDVNTPTSRYRTPTKQSPLCTPTSRYRTPTKQSPLCTPTSRYRTPHSANANVQSFKLQITKLKQNIVKLSKLNDEQSLSIEAFNDKLNRSNAILSELTNAYQHKVHQLQTLQEKYDALQMNGTRCKVQTIIDEHRCDSDGKHILLPTGYNKMTNYVQCTIFKEMDGLPGYNVLTRHCDNLSAFLDIKCGNRIDIQRCLIEQFLSSNPALMPQNEPSKLFRRVNWNLYDYKIDKIFIFHDMEEHNNMYSSKHDLGGYCICVTESETVRSIKIMKRQTKEDNAWRYLQIGTCKLYNQNVSFNEIQSVISEHGIEYIDFNQDDIEMEITYLMYMDISDLEGNDARYCMGSHACTFFCNICHTTSCDNLCEDVQFRTIETLKDGADKYAKAKAKAIPLRGLTELQISQGVKGLAVDPYPGASRIIPPRMHCDMGVTKRLYEINEDIVSELSDFETVTKSIQAIQSQIRSAKQYNQQQIKDYNAWKYSFDNYTATRHQHHFTLNEISQYMARTKTQYHQSKAQIDQFQTKLDDIKRRMETMQSCNFKMEHTTACELYNVYRNRYYKSLEGRQCKSYRCNWESICASLSETDFYVKLKPFMGDYNAMMRIISQSKQELTNQECLTLKQLKLSLNSKWKEIQSAG
eukprot:961326_1